VVVPGLPTDVSALALAEVFFAAGVFVVFLVAITNLTFCFLFHMPLHDVSIVAHFNLG
jgi:hypothetical protein